MQADLPCPMLSSCLARQVPGDPYWTPVQVSPAAEIQAEVWCVWGEGGQ